MSHKDNKIKQLELEKEELKRQITEYGAQLPHNPHFAIRDLPKFSTDACTGSGVIVTIAAVGGRMMAPFYLKDGMSPDTVEALANDLRRTFELQTQFKP